MENFHNGDVRSFETAGEIDVCSVSTLWCNLISPLKIHCFQNPESYVPASSLRGEELEKYRQTWTLDSAVARSVRYTTESRRAANAAPEAFRVASVRLLPGTPKPVERFRDRLLEKYGILGISALRYHLGSGVISCSNFRASLSKLDIKLSPSEFSQVSFFFIFDRGFYSCYILLRLWELSNILEFFRLLHILRLLRLLMRMIWLELWWQESTVLIDSILKNYFFDYLVMLALSHSMK